MLVTPRTYQLSQTPNRGLSLAPENFPSFHTLRGWSIPSKEIRQAAEMLLVHQIGSVRIGEVVRYSLTYTPSADRILPYPAELYVKVRNTSAIALRAAYLHGPYTFHTSCYPSTFDPNSKFEDHKTEGIPQYEPHVQPGAVWDAVVQVPERVRNGTLGQSITWTIEIASQVIFSNTVNVNFEVLVGRDAKSVELGAASISGLPAPGQVEDHRQTFKEKRGSHSEKVRGVYSDSVKLVVDDTTTLWTSPRFPSWDDKVAMEHLRAEHTQNANLGHINHAQECHAEPTSKNQKRKKVHFVVLTHGLHSNLGADMLYMKESIDAAASQASRDRKAAREARRKSSSFRASDVSEGSDSEDEEQVIVRGFPGNAGRTERGIQYLGKRLAKYILLMTYPDQPYLPVKRPKKLTFGYSFGFHKDPQIPQVQASHSGTIERREPDHKNYAYQITSISFIGHSLGGLVQTYAIAYIQKHSPEFFDLIKPMNFVALASPFLGLSNENPLYVKFALDFGLVGRTGQDLGLSWTAPSKMRNGWGAMIGGLGSDANKSQDPDPGAKPLLRILPSGPAHQVLKKFKNRTVYSNVVNDGIVPLRTSCLLFLDWRGLEKVEKARRENGLVGTVAEWSWAAITGTPSNRPGPHTVNTENIGITRQSPSSQPGSGSDDDGLSTTPELPVETQFLNSTPEVEERTSPTDSTKSGSNPLSNPFSTLLSFLNIQNNNNRRGSHTPKIYKRSQTIRASSQEDPSGEPRRPLRPRGDSLYEEDGLYTPPKTTIFEAAGHVLSPPLPPLEFLLDPASRPRTIFHDRVYHPEDIPPPPPARARSKFRTSSYGGHSDSSTHENVAKHGSTSSSQQVPTERPSTGSSGLKIEEKIARAYHRDVAWRKVLVRLEPDAHNNIIVRRKFANAHGWPVVKHLVDTHFAYTQAATTADDKENDLERAFPLTTTASVHGEEVEGQVDKPKSSPPVSPRSPPVAPDNKVQFHRLNGGCEENDTVPEMPSTPRLAPGSPQICASPIAMEDKEGRPQRPQFSRHSSSLRSMLSKESSAQWTDRYLEDGDDDDESDDPETYTTLGEEARKHSLKEPANNIENLALEGSSKDQSH